VYIQRSGAERMTLEVALKHHLSEISPTKKPTTQHAEATKAQQLISHLGKYNNLSRTTAKSRPTGNPDQAHSSSQAP
jgi:hypothetical protein